MDMKSRALDWYRQAENEFAWAKDSMRGHFWAQVCFTAQQVAEKAIKAIALSRGAGEIRSHSVARIAEELGIDGELAKCAKRLDMYYISTRYPDSFSEGAPFEYFDEEQAVEALEFAQAFLDRAKSELGVDA